MKNLQAISNFKAIRPDFFAELSNMMFTFNIAINNYFYVQNPTQPDMLRLLTNDFMNLTKINLINFNNCDNIFENLDIFLNNINNIYLCNSSIFDFMNYQNNNLFRLDLKDWQKTSSIGFFNDDEVRFFYEYVFKKSAYFKDFEMFILICSSEFNTTCYNSYDEYKNSCFSSFKLIIENDITNSIYNFDNISEDNMWYIYKRNIF